MNRVAIVGQGYVGLPLALEAANSGWHVTGIEVDTERFHQLSKGISPIEDITNSKLRDALERGSYVVNHNFETLSQADIIVICVPTPLSEDGMPNLLPLREVVQEIINRASNEAVVINESTSYPGTVRKEIEAKVMRARPDSRMLFVAAPERVDPGNQTFNHRNTPRVIGSTSPEGAKRAQKFYESFCSKVIVCSDPETVEMAKLLENSFRLVNIALINQIAEICTSSQINVREVISAAQTKPFGFMAFKPGLGVGGHCIPVDPMYLAWHAKNIASNASLIELSSKVNLDRTQTIARRIQELLPAGGKVQIVGLGYKAETQDTRESPSIELVKILREFGFSVLWMDPYVKHWNGEKSEEINKVDLLVYVHPYLKESELDGFTGTIIDVTGTLQGRNSVLSL